MGKIIQFVLLFSFATAALAQGNYPPVLLYTLVGGVPTAATGSGAVLPGGNPPPVLCYGLNAQGLPTPCVFSGSGVTFGGDLSGTSTSQTVIGIDGVPLCTGFTPTNGQVIEYTTASSPNPCYTAAAGSGTGTVTTVSVVPANGVSGSVATPTTTPAITLTLGAITPTSTNGVSAATMAFLDATSSVQTQLNGKQANLSLVAGTYVNGDLCTYTTSGTVLNCNTAPSGGSVTSVGWTGGIVSVATPTSTPAFTIAGTSGGVPYFSSSSTWASSGAMASGQFMLGGGAGSAPTTSFSIVPAANGGTGQDASAFTGFGQWAAGVYSAAILTAAQIGTAINLAQYDLIASGGTTSAPTGIVPSATANEPLVSAGSSANPAFGTTVAIATAEGTASSSAVTLQSGQDFSGSTANGALNTIRGNDQTGAGGASSTAGGVLIRGGNQAATNASATAGPVEILPGTATGATAAPHAPLLIAQPYYFSGSYAQWGLVCSNGTAMTVGPCGAYPGGGILIGVAQSSSAASGYISVALPGSQSPVKSSNSAAVGNLICANSTAGSGTAATGSCSTGPPIGVVVSISGSGQYPDNTTYTLSATLPLVQLSFQGELYYNSAVATSAIVKDSGGGTMASSSMIDNATAVSTVEPIYGTNGTVTFTPATGIVATSSPGTSTGLVFPATTVTIPKVYRGECKVFWQQATGISNVTFGLTTSAAATNGYASTSSWYPLVSGTFQSGSITSAATTTISSAIAPIAFATTYETDVSVLLSQTTTANTLTLTAWTGNASDAVNIQPGSFCTWLP